VWINVAVGANVLFVTAVRTILVVRIAAKPYVKTVVSLVRHAPNIYVKIVLLIVRCVVTLCAASMQESVNVVQSFAIAVGKVLVARIVRWHFVKTAVTNVRNVMNGNVATVSEVDGVSRTECEKDS